MRREKRDVESRIGPTGALRVEQHRRPRDVDQDVLRTHVAVNQRGAVAAQVLDRFEQPLRDFGVCMPPRRRRTVRVAAPTASPCCRMRPRVRLRCALCRCSAASSSPISVPTAGRTSPWSNCVFQLVQRAGSNQPEHREPHCGIVGDDRGHLPRRDFGRESQPPHFLDIAPHRSKPLARDLQARQRALDAIRLRPDVNSPQFRRHAAGDRRKSRVRGVEQSRDALRELRIDRRPGEGSACKGISQRRDCLVHAGFDRREASAHS